MIFDSVLAQLGIAAIILAVLIMVVAIATACSRR